MRFVERQARLEKRTYEAIDELEDIFDVEVPNYPEVRWLGRKGHFEDLGLAEYYREDIESLQKNGQSVLVTGANVIVLNINEPKHINEEASHYVHFNISNIHKGKRMPDEWLLVSAIVEMFGFLGSKILDPSRKNDFNGRPDYFQIARNKKVPFEDAVQKLNALPEKFENEFIYTQGYSLGERIFYALETGQISSAYVNRLFRQGFCKSGQATKAFRDLRQEVWPI